MLEGSLSRTVQRIRDAGGQATAVAADVSTEPECVRLVEERARPTARSTFW